MRPISTLSVSLVLMLGLATETLAAIWCLTVSVPNPSR